MKELQLQDIYSVVSIIEQSVHYGEEFWNHNVDYFCSASAKFSKETLLHQYIVTRTYNYYHRDFLKNGDCFERGAYSGPI